MPLARLESPRPSSRLFKLALCLSLCGAVAAVLRGRLAPSASAATTFVVNSAGDGADANTADGLCADSGGNCTLRAAIQQPAPRWPAPSSSPPSIAPASEGREGRGQ